MAFIENIVTKVANRILKDGLFWLHFEEAITLKNEKLSPLFENEVISNYNSTCVIES